MEFIYGRILSSYLTNSSEIKTQNFSLFSSEYNLDRCVRVRMYSYPEYP